MTDEGMFRPPGAPGAELRPWRDPAGSPPPRTGPPAHPAAAPGAPTEPRPGWNATGSDGARSDSTRSAEPVGAGSGGGDDPQPSPAGVPSGGGAAGTPARTAWRLYGIGAAVALYLVAGLTWYHIGGDRCAQFYPADADYRSACEHVAASGWQASRFGVWLALGAGVLLVLRLARRGPAVIDLAAVAAAGVADILAVRALVSSPDQQMNLTWPGPVAMLPLLALLTVAAVQAYRVTQQAGELSLRDVGEQARQQLSDTPLRLPGWLRPASVWRRRRRWLAGAGVFSVVLVAHSCAKDGPLGGLGDQPRVNGANLGGLPAPRGHQGQQGQGQPQRSEEPRPTPSPSPAAPDGATLLTGARESVAAATTVEVQFEKVGAADVRGDLRLTRDGRADGKIFAPLRTYEVRRVGSQCWVRGGLDGHGVAAWVPTCTVPAAGGAPTLDVAALTDWRVMVAALPDPAGARTAAETERLGVTGGPVWHVTAADGSSVFVLADSGTDPRPVSVIPARPRPGGVTQVDYPLWNDPVTITPPA